MQLSEQKTKGQLISKGLFGLLNSSKKTNEKIRPEVSKSTILTAEKWYFVTKIVLTYCEKKLF